MTTNLHSKKARQSGMSLIELTVVLVVLLMFLGMVFIGAKAWKTGSDRAACILNIYHAQEAVRSYSNLNGFNPGQTLASVDVEAQVFGLDGFMDKRPSCPAQGSYVTKGNTIPAFGTLYLSCSLAGSARHQPEDFGQW